MSANQIREIVAEKISADNPMFNVKAYPAEAPENFGSKRATQVSVFRTELTNGPSILIHEVAIELMVGKSDEDYLDESLDEVLLSIQRIPGLTWSSATRTVFDDKYNGYRITLSAPTKNLYKEIVASEGAL